MDNEQVSLTSIQEPTTETVTTVEESNTTVQVEATPKTFTEEEFNKAIQSASSKAKNEILKDLGINSVKEFKDLQATYNTAISEKDTLVTQKTELENEIASLKINAKIAALGVAEEFKDDFLELTEVKMSKTNKSFDEVSKEILEKNQHWLTANKINKLGNDRSDVDKKADNGVSEELKSKYPWLK